jgi:hypothetical protein
MNTVKYAHTDIPSTSILAVLDMPPFNTGIVTLLHSDLQAAQDRRDDTSSVEEGSQTSRPHTRM